MRKLLYSTTLAMLAMLMFAPAAFAQSGGPSGVVEIAPGGPCATPGIAEDITGVPIEELPNAFLNRNDPVGTPLSSPLDPDGNGIACDTPTSTAPVVGADDGICVGPGEVDPDCAEALRQSLEGQAADIQYAPETPTATPVAALALPDTGGASLVALGAGALLVIGGLVMRRR